MFNPISPLGMLVTMFQDRWNKARSEEGASAVEWVIIAAIVVGICIAIAGILRSALEGEANEIGNEISSQ